MKVVCVDNIDYNYRGEKRGLLSLTIGKSYDVVIKRSINLYAVRNDSGNISNYHIDNFVSIREYNLDELLK